MIYFGIDFGTSNSCLAFYNGSTLTVIDPEVDRLPGARVYPSVVTFDKNGYMIAAGWHALGLGTVMPHLMVDQVKRWIGKPYDEVITDPRIKKLGYKIVEKDGKAQVQMGNKTYSPEDIVTYILSHIVREGIAYLNNNGIDIKEKVSVIVTYPAYYAQNQVEAIREAVKKVKEQVTEIDLDSIKLIPEPTASVCKALYDGKISKDDQYVMVIDEGAGTLDTLLVDLSYLGARGVEAKGISIGGQAMLGGSDMDTRILDWVMDELRKDPNIKAEALKNINLRQLRAHIEAAKIDISEGRTKVAQIKVPGFARFIELTEAQLETLVSPIIEKCRVEIDNSLKEIENKHMISRGKITKIIKVGGPTRMNSFQAMISRLFPCAMIIDLNPMECVAEGAAVSSAVSYKIPAERTYGLIKRESGSEEFIPAITKDTPLPAARTVTWKTQPFEDIIIEAAQVLDQGEREISCLSMGKYNFPAPSSAATYHIVFKLDEERNAKVTVFKSREKAEQYLAGTLPADSGDFRLEFRREVATRIIETGPDWVDPDPKFLLFLETARSLMEKMRTANKQLEDTKRIISEFGTDLQSVRDLYQKKTEVEGYLGRISGMVETKLGAIRSENEADARNSMLAIEAEILRSDELINMSLKADELGTLLKNMDLYYDKAKILALVNRIATTKNDAWVKVQKHRAKIQPETEKEIVSLVTELESIQAFLEARNEVHANSIEVEMYRKGKIKEQELKNKVDQLVVVD